MGEGGIVVYREPPRPHKMFSFPRLSLLRPTADTQREAVCCALTELLWKVRPAWLINDEILNCAVWRQLWSW